MASEFTHNGYELVKLTPDLFDESQALMRIAFLVKDTKDPDVEAALSHAFLAQVDVLVPIMARVMKLRENMKILELKEELED